MLLIVWVQFLESQAELGSFRGRGQYENTTLLDTSRNVMEQKQHVPEDR